MNSKQTAGECGGMLCDVCGEVIQEPDKVEWKERPANFERPAESVPTHEHCAFHTCEGMTGEISP